MIDIEREIVVIRSNRRRQPVGLHRDERGDGDGCCASDQDERVGGSHFSSLSAFAHSLGVPSLPMPACFGVTSRCSPSVVGSAFRRT